MKSITRAALASTIVAASALAPASAAPTRGVPSIKFVRGEELNDITGRDFFDFLNGMFSPFGTQDNNANSEANATVSIGANTASIVGSAEPTLPSTTADLSMPSSSASLPTQTIGIVPDYLPSVQPSPASEALSTLSPQGLSISAEISIDASGFSASIPTSGHDISSEIMPSPSLSFPSASLTIPSIFPPTLTLSLPTQPSSESIISLPSVPSVQSLSASITLPAMPIESALGSTPSVYFTNSVLSSPTLSISTPLIAPEFSSISFSIVSEPSASASATLGGGVEVVP
ncbi:hypothetical protein HGRIS_008555 [Hohenbuehelia grisea]|uniref:Uncharacterized protein n=1 Tax=Hohenbuehelia grisea TaxID=104357 RepID=A0ABR3J8U4_9AGAR